MYSSDVENVNAGDDRYDNYTNICKYIINKGGKVIPLIVDKFDETEGTGFCNGCILKVGDKLLVNVRHVEYDFYQCSKFYSKFEGKLSYYHRDNDLKLRTNNYLGELNPDTCTFENYRKVDTGRLDKKPLWDFIGLEDARIINWDDKVFLCGVRRDTTPNGQGRMEMSEIEDWVEVNRTRIEAPDVNSYCEKNWMPILDKPYHFIKWSNPVEVVKVDMDRRQADTVLLGDDTLDLKWGLRGGTQVVRWDEDTYIAILHECYFIPRDTNGYKDSIYRHRFIVWDNQFKLKMLTQPFDFMGGKVEFCTGMDIDDQDVYITFGYQDSSCFAIKTSRENIEELIWRTLKPTFKNT